MNGVFVSNYTKNGDLERGVELLNPQYLFYRVGIFAGTRYVFDDTLRYRMFDMVKIPTYIFQPYGSTGLLANIIEEVEGKREGVVAIDVELNISDLSNRLTKLYESLLEHTNLTPILYTNLDFIIRYKLLTNNLVTSYPLWFAYYSDRLKTVKWKGGIAVWQSAPKVNYKGIFTLNMTVEHVLNQRLFEVGVE